MDDIDAHLVIDWTLVRFYNTVMGLAAGAAIASLGRIAWALVRITRIDPRGWAINLLVLGFILFPTGLHMTLTWPLAPMGSADNIAFGEPTLVLGALCIGLGFYFWRQAAEITGAQSPLVHVATDLRHLRFLLIGVGLALIAIAAAGPTWHLYTAPPEEPIAGLEAVLGVPYLTTYAISGLWAAIGVIAVFTPFTIDRIAREDGQITRLDLIGIGALTLLGIALMLMSAAVYFTHIGMVLNTAA